MPSHSTTLFLFKVRVSRLASFDFCEKRSYLEISGQVKKKGNFKSMSKGSSMHKIYSVPYKSFDRRVLRYKLWVKHRNLITRILDNIQVRGKIDDFRVLQVITSRDVIAKKVVSIIEVKTTGRKSLWSYEIRKAVFQLQLYVWILVPILKELGYTLHKRHYVEIYSQKTGKLIKRVVVRADPNIEKKIRHIVRVWKGMVKTAWVPMWVCKRCPRQVKEVCPRLKFYKGEKKWRA